MAAKCGSPVLRRILLAAAGLSLMLSCTVPGGNLPSELIGTWSYTSGGYYKSYQFAADHVYYTGYSVSYPGQFRSTWDSAIEQVWLDKSMLRLKSGNHFVWHIVGDHIWLVVTNPSDPEPSLSGEWWNAGAYGMEQFNRE